MVNIIETPSETETPKIDLRICGSESTRATFEEVDAVKTPQATETWRPIGHSFLIDKVKNRLEATARKHLDKLVSKLSEGVSEEVDEGMGLVLNKEIFFGLQKLISKNAKNNKLKGYSSEVSHAVTDILVAVEEDRLAIGDVFNGLKTITKKIEK